MINQRLSEAPMACPVHGQIVGLSLAGRAPVCPSCAEHSRRAENVRHYEAERARCMNATLAQIVPDMYLGRRIADWRPNMQADNQLAILRRVRSYMEELERPQGQKSLVLYGPTGTGKTLLAYIILQHVFRTCYNGHSPVAAITSAAFQGMCRQSWTDKTAPTDTMVIEDLGRVPLVLLDELGQGDTASGDSDRLARLIDRRYQLQLPTIITTNLPDKDAIRAHIGDRSMDRINELCIWARCAWPSYRQLSAAMEDL
jgi:DNA replication protein DnaC